MDKIKLKITSNSTEFYIYTHTSTVPSQSQYTYFTKSIKSEFIVESKNSGRLIALFNPDFDNPISKNHYNP
jgi:hypothetical protein